MRTAFFRAHEPGKGTIEFESRAETNKEAADRGRAWAKASGWTNITIYLYDEHHVQSIANFKRIP